jgi:hypothetical protein
VSAEERDEDKKKSARVDYWRTSEGKNHSWGKEKNTSTCKPTRSSASLHFTSLQLTTFVTLLPHPNQSCLAHFPITSAAYTRSTSNHNLFHTPDVL